MHMEDVSVVTDQASIAASEEFENKPPPRAIGNLHSRKL